MPFCEVKILATYERVEALYIPGTVPVVRQRHSRTSTRGSTWREHSSGCPPQIDNILLLFHVLSTLCHLIHQVHDSNNRQL
jgi:hypothetical protein